MSPHGLLGGVRHCLTWWLGSPMQDMPGTLVPVSCSFHSCLKSEGGGQAYTPGIQNMEGPVLRGVLACPHALGVSAQGQQSEGEGRG